MEIYVLVKAFQGVVDGVEIYTDHKKAEKGFKEYTGYNYRDWDPEEHPNYDETKIMVKPVKGVIHLDDLTDEARARVMDQLGIIASHLDPASKDYLGENPAIAVIPDLWRC